MARRRANGEGSIYPRTDGRWEGYISIGGLKRQFFLGRTHGEVKAKLDVARKAKLDGVPTKFERKRFSDFIDDWLASVQSSLKARTWTRYEQLIRVHAKPAIGKLQLEKITPQHVQRLYAKMLENGSAEATVLQLHAVLHKAFKQAVRWDLVGRNVLDAVVRPKRQRQEMKTFSPEQARRFLEAAHGDRYEALFVLALTTGMRQGELLALGWDDIDLDNGVVHLQRSVQRTKAGFQVTDPKTRGSRRQIELAAIATRALEAHRVNQTAERLLTGSGWKDEGLVFATKTGGYVDASHVLRHCFYPLLDRASLPRIRFHDLRHTAATLMMAQGTHPKVVSEMLGHSTIAITMDLYSHVSPTMQQNAVAALDSLLTE